MAIPLAVGPMDTSLTVRLVPIPRVLEEVRVRERRLELRYRAIVVDEFGEPVTDAEVIAAGFSSKRRTDANGQVVVPDVKRGTLMVRVRSGRWCTDPTCILINGLRPVMRPLMSFRANEVEAIEYFPGYSDWSGTIHSRTTTVCTLVGFRRAGGPGGHPGGWVIWLRNDST